MKDLEDLFEEVADAFDESLASFIEQVRATSRATYSTTTMFYRGLSRAEAQLCADMMTDNYPAFQFGVVKDQGDLFGLSASVE